MNAKSFKKYTTTLPVHAPTPAAIEVVYETRGLVVHKGIEMSGWAVSQKSSGLRAVACPTRKAAKECADKLAEMHDWTDPLPEYVRDVSEELASKLASKKYELIRDGLAWN